MNLNWINQINSLREQQRKELAIYYENRARPLIAAIEDAKKVKQQAIENAQKVFSEIFNK